MEVENNNSIPFLDVLITKSNNSFSHTVYQNPTYTNCYLNAKSQHHPAQLNSVLNSLVHRSIRLTDNHNRSRELFELEAALHQNDYLVSQIQRSIQRQTQTSPHEVPEEQTNQTKTFLLSIHGVTDKVSRILKKHNVKTVFAANNQISAILKTPKDTIRNEAQGIYEIPCSNCSRTYIGQTSRRISNRAYEHELAVRKSDPATSLFKHHQETGHTVSFENAKAIATEKNLQARIIREAIEIEKQDDSQRLPQTWRSLL
ncbi:uncharacterized protein [Leptinotarsa decemlineata]|uniref:uncharacterized protein n=1 Tax=Leptinotarsa decemlineata TaxID=7539 RepID=UPI003D307C2A